MLSFCDRSFIHILSLSASIISYRAAFLKVIFQILIFPKKQTEKTGCLTIAAG
ncbi:hypothetical protein CHCC14814_2546 [Bacillus paralicheniformis]|nr:hypothetical protein CHCC14814_2546 [Bacillus paralicheniformis]